MAIDQQIRHAPVLQSATCFKLIANMTRESRCDDTKMDVVRDVIVSTISRQGELITTDVLGPLPVSVDGYRYAISFTDEFSRLLVNE